MDTIKPELPAPLSATAHENTLKPAGMVASRRQYSTAFKRKVVEETINGKDSVSVVARRYDINANMLFRWRREYSTGQYSGSSQPLIPVSVSIDPVMTCTPGAPSAVPATGHVQVTLNNGHQVMVTGQVEPSQLQMLLNTLSKC